MKYMKSTLLLMLVVLSGTACTEVAVGDNLQTLSAQRCIPLATSAFKVTLPAEWQPYLSATRVCPLAQGAEMKASIVLVSVFQEDYYRDKPADAKWEHFPKPIFFNNQGRCVARLPELYPDEPPREITLSYGHWQATIPGTIRLQVSNPAVGGNYDLPTLSWDTQQQHYLPNSNSTHIEKGSMVCPPQ